MRVKILDTSWSGVVWFSTEKFPILQLSGQTYVSVGCCSAHGMDVASYCSCL